MTSRRRDAERAVIAAARVLVSFPAAMAFEDRLADVTHAVEALDAIDLANHGAKPSALTPETSHDAYVSMRHRFSPDAQLVIDALRLADRRATVGLTTEQLCYRLGRKHQSISARVNELRDGGWIIDTGQRRKTTSGRQATVWGLSRRAKDRKDA